MSEDQPYIDFDGDGDGDSYTTTDLDDGGHSFAHHDADGNVDAIAYDYDGNGLVDALDVDNDHDGDMDHHHTDTDRDGWMDTEEQIPAEPADAPPADPGADDPGRQAVDGSFERAVPDYEPMDLSSWSETGFGLADR